MKKYLQRQQGFTLVELILYIGITAMVMLTLAAFAGLLLQSRLKNMTISEVDQQGIQAMQIMTQTIRNAPTVNTPTLGSTATNTSVTATDSAKSPTVFSLSGGSIQMQEGVSQAVPLTTSKVVVSNLTFKNVSRATNSASLKIQYTVSFNNTSGKSELNYVKTFYGTATLRK